jgi:ABC-type dipeptide/oligopeptide/nickel transport system ATPase component|tara:strand:- start:293 stop:1162 length:870 start_codon:yes stop_codon:yes gene_type:complete
MYKKLLKIKDLELSFKMYEGMSYILKKINLELDGGEKVALVGESGSGKSVTTKLILGLLNQKNVYKNGKIIFNNRDILNLSQNEFKKIRGNNISIIFQDPMAALNPVFKIKTQFHEVNLNYSNKISKKDSYIRSCNALEKVSIRDPERVMESYPFQLSGGLAQRVVITMAMINKPELLLADEPSTALDVTVQNQALDLMDDLTRQTNTAVLLITHNMGVVRKFAEKVYVIYRGVIVEEGTKKQIFDNPGHPYTNALLNAIPKLSGEGLPKHDENPPDYGLIPKYTHKSQ